MKEMKKTVFVMAILAIALKGLTQSTSVPDSDYYLQKSKKQKTAAFVLLGGGAGLAAIGLAMGTASFYDEIGSIVVEGEDDETYVAASILFGTGLAAMVGSVPLFIASSRNKKKAHAASASIKLQTIPVVSRQGIGKLPYPAASIRISL